MRWLPLLGVVLLVAGATGCCTSPGLPSESRLVPPPPPLESREPVAPPVRPTPIVRAPEPELRIPEPPPPPKPVVPPTVAIAIQDLADKYPGLFIFDKARGMLRFNSDITFDSGSAVVKPDARAALVKLAQILAGLEARDRLLTVVGHTDSDAVKKAATIASLKALHKSADNMGLSEARAEAVADILRTGGIDAGRMATQGKGQTDPIADNKTAAGKARNRRVDIFISMGATSPAGR